MNRVRFFIPGDAVAKQRPRVVRRGGTPIAFTPAKTTNYEALVRMAAHKAMEGRPPFDAPLDLVIIIQLSVPESWSKRRKAQALSGMVRPSRKPDWDNVAKSICDGMDGVCFVNDSRIVDAKVQKFYDKAPGVFVDLCVIDGVMAA